MSANCIQTKLMGSVENNDLPKLGRVEIIYDAAGEYEFSAGGYGVVLNAVNATVKYKSSGNVVNMPLTMNQDYATAFIFVADSANSKVTIDNKYELVGISGRFNLNQLLYCQKIKVLSNSNNGPWFFGDISCLKTLPLLEKFFPALNHDIYGDIGVLGYCPNIHEIGIRGTTQVTGTVESIITKLIVGGRTSATTKETGIIWTSLIQQELVTFNGVKPNTNGYFIWSAGETVGQYVITYKASSDDSTISSVTVTVE